MVTAAKQYFGLLETEQVRFIESDGRVYLNRHKEPYDLILVDAFREKGVPFHLLTREFYTLVKERLTPGGVMAMNLAGGTKLYVSSLVTLRAVFATVDVYPDWADRSEVQSIVVAVPGEAPNLATLTQRAAALQDRYHFRYRLPDLLKKRVANQNADGGELLTDDFAPVNLYETTPAGGRKRR